MPEYGREGQVFREVTPVTAILQLIKDAIQDLPLCPIRVVWFSFGSSGSDEFPPLSVKLSTAFLSNLSSPSEIPNGFYINAVGKINSVVTGLAYANGFLPTPDHKRLFCRREQ